MIPSQILCHGVHREGVKLRPVLASELFCSVPFRKIWSGVGSSAWTFFLCILDVFPNSNRAKSTRLRTDTPVAGEHLGVEVASYLPRGARVVLASMWHDRSV